MAFHLMEAETAADVQRVASVASVEVERIVSAVGVDPAGGDGSARGVTR
jgi:hypothetical protein